jgi:hypothetical protein
MGEDWQIWERIKLIDSNFENLYKIYLYEIRKRL